MDAAIFHKQVDDFIYKGTTFLKSNQYVIAEQVEDTNRIQKNPFAMMKAGKPSYSDEQTKEKESDVSVKQKRKDSKNQRITTNQGNANQKNGSETKEESAEDNKAIATVFFAFDEYNISPEGYEKLKDIVLDYEDNKKPALKITGYTDCVGSKQYNDMLALKRAMTVAGYLQRHGFDTAVEGKGDCCFKKTEELSRRAEVEISDKKRGSK